MTATWTSGGPRRMYRIEHLFSAPRESGGGIGVHLGNRMRLDRAIELGVDRLTHLGDPTGHDRIMISRRIPGRPEHPRWLYLDGNDRVCLWQKRPWQKRDLWGYCW